MSKGKRSKIWRMQVIHFLDPTSDELPFPAGIRWSHRYFRARARTFVSKCDDVMREPGR